LTSLLSAGCSLALAVVLLGACDDNINAQQGTSPDAVLLGVHIQAVDAGTVHPDTCGEATTSCGSCLSASCCSELVDCGSDPTCACFARCTSAPCSCMPDGAAEDVIWSALGTCASAHCVTACAEVIP
jgi:hypothetical protein